MTAYDSIERDAADVVERRHRRTFTLTQLLVACVAACCCALAATTVRSTHHEGWGFIRRVRRAPRRPVHFFRGPSADERLKTCESDLKAQKDVNDKRTTELKTCQSDLKAQKDVLKACKSDFKAQKDVLKTCESDLKAQKDENKKRTTESACTESEGLSSHSEVACEYVYKQRQLSEKVERGLKEGGQHLYTCPGRYTWARGEVAMAHKLQNSYQFRDLCSQIAKIDGSRYEYQPDGNLWSFVRKSESE